jgi:NCS1 family nucleobase:cation symporter-1
MSKDGSLHFEGGWNKRALIALAIAGSISIGLSLLGAYGIIVHVGDWGWLIGATLGALMYTALMRGREAPSLSRSGAAA